MLDLIPFLDEVYIVEQGRHFLSGVTTDSIVLEPNGLSAFLVSYAGCGLQELMFRLFGVPGARIAPFAGHVAIWYFTRLLLAKTSLLSKTSVHLLALATAFLPLLFQSSLLVRVDSWAVASTLAVLATLGTPTQIRRPIRLAAGGFFAALSVFIWPTAFMVAFLYPVFCFDLKHTKEFFLFCLFGLLSVAALSVPLLPHLQQMLLSLRTYTGSHSQTAISISNILVNFARECARDPLFLAASAFGFVLWIRQRRYMLVLAFAAMLVLAEHSGLYTFRFLYFIPAFLLMCATTAERLEGHHPRATRTLLGLFLAYGILTGPVGYLVLPHKRLPDNLKESLAQVVGTGPKRIYSRDYATYYIGRELGWKQFAHFRLADDSNPKIVEKSLERADAVILRDWDPYETIQQSCTPYGLFCKHLLQSAKREKNSPNKSWCARLGETYANLWRHPFDVKGFDLVATLGCIKVYLRNASGAHD